MAEKKFFVDINLQGSALTNAKIGTNSGIGSTEGAFGYDSGSHRLQYFNGTATQNVANLSDISAVTGGLIFQGGYDPTTDTPDITDGTALKGFFWAATAAGTFLGESVQVGDSIVAKVDNAGATIADWLILQGNIVIATDSVDGISRLATQTEANDGTEAGAVVITPATLQGKIDAQITPEISSKLPLAGGTMSGNIDMGGNDITARNIEATNQINTPELVGNNPAVGGGINIGSPLNVAGHNIAMNDGKITTLGTPTAGGDATNKTYVDGAASDAQANAEAYADSLAPNYDAAGSAAQALTDANDYTDTGLATKLDLAGGTMSGTIDMNGAQLLAASISNSALTTDLFANDNKITSLLAPTNDGDAANKEYVDNAAATAESNANAYTDTELNASRYTEQINTSWWTLVDNVYTYTLQHFLSSAYPVVQLFDNNNMACELGVEVIDAQSILLKSNIMPNMMFVTVLKGGAY